MKRKKTSRCRGTHTHGGGSKKKRRGAGNRGGRGRAGSGKKGDCKKPMYWKEQPKKGFYSIGSKKEKAINLADLNEQILASGVKGNSYEINLKEQGYSKLLGTGNTNLKMKISVDSASQSAIDKVTKAGGVVNILKVKKEVPKETPKEEPKAKLAEEPKEEKEVKEDTPETVKESKEKAPVEVAEEKKPEPAKETKEAEVPAKGSDEKKDTPEVKEEVKETKQKE